MGNIRYYYLSKLKKDDLLNVVAAQKAAWMSGGIYGMVKGNSMKLTHRSGYSKPWMPMFAGIVSEKEEGTMIEGIFDLPDFTKIFVAAWRGSVTLFFLLALVTILTSPGSSKVSLLFLLVPMMMFALSFVFVIMANSIGKESRDEIIRFFETKLFARNISE